jgi:hypothetical protein
MRYRHLSTRPNCGETIKFLILIVIGVVLPNLVKNATHELNTRTAVLGHWRDEHISIIEPYPFASLMTGGRSTSANGSNELSGRSID